MSFPIRGMELPNYEIEEKTAEEFFRHFAEGKRDIPALFSECFVSYKLI